MKAAVCHAFNTPLVIEEVALRAPQKGEVEVDIKAVAICHSDILFAEGAWGGTLPAVYGHEGAGVVRSIGEGVTGLAVGDRVLVTMIRSCGHCGSCAGGHPATCETRIDTAKGPLSMPDGSVLDQGLNTAAFAERVVVDHSQIVKLPGDIPMDSACLLACGVITGVGAATNSAQIKPGSSVVVIGVGGVGLNAIQGAKICGASRIIAVDLSEEKLAAAREFGATDTVLASSDKPHRAVKAMTGGRGADYVLVAAGAVQAFQTAPQFLCVGGTLVMVGMPPSGAKVTYEPVMVAKTAQTMKGSSMGDTVLARDIPYLVDLYKQGRLKLDELITRRYPLSQINEAIADTVAGKALRNVIIFD